MKRPYISLGGVLLIVATSFAQDPIEPTAKLKPRPEKTDAEYTTIADELRKLYEKPSSEWPEPTLAKGVKNREIGLLPLVLHPKDNPHSNEKVALGKMLFFDPRLSESKQIACASCHDPDLAWTDGRTTSFGNERKVLRRNAPSIANAGLATNFFWDGRAASLEEQARAVLLNEDEMHSSEKIVVERLKSSRGYRDAFKAAFEQPEITLTKATQAIATFERTIVGGRSKFDRFMSRGNKEFSDSEIRGLHLFRTDARCMNCHNGPTFTDGEFHDVGLSYYGRLYEDLGRYRITKKNEDVGKFKTPTLRNIGHTAPYMHVGFFELPGVLNMYNAGMPTLRRKPEQAEDPLFPTKSDRLQTLNLNKKDLADLEAFLRTLDEPKLRVRPPELPKMGDVGRDD